MRRGVFLALGWLGLCAGLALIALAAAGYFFPSSRVGARGLLAFGSYGPWIVLAAAVIFAVGLIARAAGPRIVGALAAATGALALLTGLVVLVPQLVLAMSEGAPIGPANVLGFAPPNSEPDRVEIYRDEDGEQLRAAVWLPRNEAAGAGPAVLWMHGGSFRGGSFLGGSARHRALADAGYAVISIEYRLAPPPRWREANGDVACALGWVRGQADELRINPEQVVLGGTSAGGTLALNVAYGLGQPEDKGGITSSCGKRPEPPAAVYALHPPTDLAAPGTAGELLFEDYLGGTPAQAEEAYAYASPSDRIRRGLPRTLLIYGEADELIDPAVTADFITRVRNEGNNPITALAYPFGSHTFDRPATLGESVADRAVLRWLYQWFPQEA